MKYSSSIVIHFFNSKVDKVYLAVEKERSRDDAFGVLETSDMGQESCNYCGAELKNEGEGLEAALENIAHLLNCRLDQVETGAAE